MCPFHGWCYGVDGTNTGHPAAQGFRRAQRAARRHRSRVGALRDVGRLRVDQLRQRRAARAPVHGTGRDDPRHVAASSSCGSRSGTRRRLPVNWKLAIEAFVESYHVVVTHPEMNIPGMRYSMRPDAPFDPQAFIEAEIDYLRVLSDGMDGMVHANDVRVAETLRGLELPADPDASDPGVEPRAQRCGDAVAPGRAAQRCRISTRSTRRASTRPSTTASRTTSCCPCTAARRRTASGRWVRRRR